MASVTFEQVAVSEDRTTLIEGVDVHIDHGEFVAIVGPSGSGKTTVLRGIAGLATVSAGRLLIGDVDVTASGPGQRDLAMVFQEPSLLPKRTGRRNVQFPLEVRRETLESIRSRVDAEARALHIEHLLEKWPRTMSRGEAQLVQMARALVRVPQVLLLDEPFAALDAPRRRALRSEIKLLQRGYGVTTVMATNDPDDALALAHRVIALEPGPPGRVVQVGALAEVRDEPATASVGAALGDLWLLAADVHLDAEGAWLVGVRDPSLRLRSWSPVVSAHAGSRVTIGLRSSAIVPSPTGAHRAVVNRVIPGSDPRLMLELGGHVVISTHVDEQQPDDEIRVDLDRPFVFDAAGSRLA